MLCWEKRGAVPVSVCAAAHRWSPAGTGLLLVLFPIAAAVSWFGAKPDDLLGKISMWETRGGTSLPAEGMVSRQPCPLVKSVQIRRL